jgi:putative ABC transport system permease protein
MRAAPPPLAERALGLAIRDTDRRDAKVGDLHEEFHHMAARHGHPYARRWYWAQAMGIAAYRVAARTTGRIRRRDVLGVPEPPQAHSGRASTLWHDLRSAWRSVRHQPALSATIVLVLALGLSANATIFALVDAIVLRPFRYPGVERAAVVASDEHTRFFDRESVAPGDFLDWREQATDAFDRLAAIEWWDPQFRGDGPPQQLTGFKVSPELFEILREPAMLGRTLLPADSAAESPVVVLGYEYWQRQFGGRRDVIGRSLLLSGSVYEIVGVMAVSFRVPYGADVWAPLPLAPDARERRSGGSWMVVGRLSDGVSAADAEARLKAILASQRRNYPDTHTRREVSAYSFTEGFGDPGAGPFIAVWQVAAVVLLLVACANVANLLLARNTEREREFAVRLALGASGSRLAWQLLVEGMLLAGAATILAVPLSWAALGAMRSAFPDAIVRFVPGWVYLHLAPRTFLATAALATTAVLLFAIAPAIRAARQNVTAGLRVGPRLTSGRSRQRARMTLAAAQIALTLGLLVAAGLSLSALSRVTGEGLGFNPDGVLVGRVILPEQRYQSPESRRQFFDGVVRRLDAIPATTSAGATSVLPYSGNDGSTSFWREETPPRPADALDVGRRRVTPDSFKALGIPLLAGRGIDRSDRPDSVPVAVVSQEVVTRAWPGQSALGKRFRTAPDGPLITVVGVVGDIAQDWLVDGRRPAYYRPLDQDPPESAYIVLRTAIDPSQLAAGLRAAVMAEDAELPVVGLRTMPAVLEDRTAGLRIVGRTLGVIAAISAVFAVVGLYSLMAFLTGRRTREMGVRLALGATRGHVVRLTCAHALRFVAAGIAAGLVLAFLVGRGLEAALFGVVRTNAALPLSLAVVLTAVALAASYFPARRVSRVDPTIALRSE